ncbi:Chitinase 1 [Fusarium oxysporum f. sp. cubense]|uniref:chitinase n=1 Tax=Fusarium oxysporum f. sp. cubense TaxID=61366 RepID=A0A559LHN3_FUSOC|nr:Chitinase 1 [Fusarium oxysporum f. sp. cubense]
MSASRKSLVASTMPNAMFTNAVYFPNYRIYQGDTPGMLNYSCINYVYYAYACVSADGGVFLSDEWADACAPVDGARGGLGSLMHLKLKYPYLRVVLSVGGGNSSQIFPMVASSTLLRDNFARSAKGLVEASGLDGIDIAWEYPCGAQQGYDFLALLAAVRIHLPEEHYVLTAALPAAKAALQVLDLTEIAKYVDHINLMTFDLFGSWMPKAGYHAQLYAGDKEETSASSGVSYLMSNGFPPSKILLGIPTFGRNFLHCAGASHEYKGVGVAEDGTIEYKLLPPKGCKEVQRDSSFVTYDNPDTVKIKADFCKQKGLGGLFYSNGVADARDKSRSLVAAGFRALHSS